MGIFDSNRIVASGREANKIQHFNGQTAIVDATNIGLAIDVSAFNTMQITASSLTAASQLSLIGWYTDNADTRNQGTIPVIEITDFTPKLLTSFTVLTGISRTYLVDVSRFSKLTIGKTTTAGACTLSYTLDQTMRGLDAYNSIKNSISSSVLSVKGASNTRISLFTSQVDIIAPSVNKIDCLDYRTLQLEITISGAVVLDLFGWLTNTGITTASPLDVYKKTSKGLVKLDDYTLSTNGLHILLVDVSLFSQFGIGKANATGSLNLSYKLTTDAINYDEISYTKDYYYKDRTTPVGDAATYEIGKQYRTGKIIVNSKNDISTLAFKCTPKGYAFSDALANANYFERLVTSDRIVVPRGTITAKKGVTVYYFDASNYVSINGGITATTGIDIIIELSTDPLPPDIYALLYPLSGNGNFKPLFNSDELDILCYDDTAMYLKSVKENLAVWVSVANTTLYLSTTGLTGTKKEIAFNSTNFPNLIDGSKILQAQFVYWTRNATTAYPGNEWRLIVITDKGQIYHNFPSRSTSNDGTVVAGDEYLFDESCIWELETRKTPVKTNTGSDLTLINTGKYYYNPMLPDIAYEMHPAISTDNGYGNGGFPATITKVNASGQNVTFGRFFQPNRNDVNCNPFFFMGGFETSEKMTVLGTYRDNVLVGCRICFFISNDGGRNWFCRYEMGANSRLFKSNNSNVLSPIPNWTYALKVSGIAAASSGQYAYRRRMSYTPSDVNKEPEKTKKFTYEPQVQIQSIAPLTDSIRITTSSAHGLDNGDVIVFDKLTGGDWDFLVNTDYTDMIGGAQVFKIKIVSSTTFDLMDCPHNPDNNLCCRHLHSINRCKDGYAIGFGEGYPNGWILYLSIIESDSFARFYPWDNLNLIRINSLPESIQRPLGVILRQDKDNTVFIGVDNEYTPLPNVSLPADRTDTFKRSSNGVFKGKLADADSQALFECVLESPEVCYLFKEVLGVMIYIGQQGHIAVSYDNGKSWVQAKVPKTFKGVLYQYGGVTTDKEIVVNNLIIKAKK